MPGADFGIPSINSNGKERVGSRSVDTPLAAIVPSLTCRHMSRILLAATSFETRIREPVIHYRLAAALSHWPNTGRSVRTLLLVFFLDDDDGTDCRLVGWHVIGH